jgi:CRP-like cAMP-binding protein
LEANEASDAQRVAYLAQCLLNFRYVRPSELDTWRAESFSPEMKYQFQVYEPIMTRRDWELILMGATRVSFKKDESIITEGAQSKQRLYYIISGTCRIEKKSGNSDPVAPIVAATPSEEPQPTTRKRSKSRGAEPEKESIAPKAEAKIVLGRMSESETFGEISFLFGGPASATIIADDNVELYIIEGSFVNILFVKYPSLGGRFYHYLASVLAHRLKKQEAKKFEENKAN